MCFTGNQRREASTGEVSISGTSEESCCCVLNKLQATYGWLTDSYTERTAVVVVRRNKSVSRENVVKHSSDAVTCWVLVGDILYVDLGAVQTRGVPAARYWPGPTASQRQLENKIEKMFKENVQIY